MLGRSLVACAFASVALAGDILWDGRFNDLSSSEDLNDWSWANQVGPYQYYIHGSGPVTSYVNLSPDYKNPADTGSNQGARITIDSTALWNSDMWRTELIPQTSAPINQGTVWYHFSMSRSNTNAPSVNHEHQVCFFESHFTEMKYGWISGQQGTSNPNLQWMVGGQSHWSVQWEAGVWHNIAYEIDFSANTVSFWHSTGSDPLTLTAGPVSASTSSNGADWHLGVLRLPRSGYDNNNPEDWYFSGVYVETGSLTTSVSYGDEEPPAQSSQEPPSSTSSSSELPPLTTTPLPPTTTFVTSTSSSSSPPTSSAQPTAVAPQWGQCGGQGWTGPTACASPFTCECQNEWYCQCL